MTHHPDSGNCSRQGAKLAKSFPHWAGTRDCTSTSLSSLASLAPWRDHSFSSLRLCAFVREFLYFLAPWCDLDRAVAGAAGQPRPHRGLSFSFPRSCVGTPCGRSRVRCWRWTRSARTCSHAGAWEPEKPAITQTKAPSPASNKAGWVQYPDKRRLNRPVPSMP